MNNPCVKCVQDGICAEIPERCGRYQKYLGYQEGLADGIAEMKPKMAEMYSNGVRDGKAESTREAIHKREQEIVGWLSKGAESSTRHEIMDELESWLNSGKE